MQTNLSQTKWPQILKALWIYTLLVILWGAWVRISHSGDGCGDHWPLCSGQLIPDFVARKTWIEYAHRLMSGSYGLIVLYVFFKFRKHASESIRKLNLSILIFMISEALLGAILVKGKLVTVDDSVVRLVVMSLHQLNSFMLTGTTYLFYMACSKPELNLKKINSRLALVFLLLPMTGAIAALSTTLFPSFSLWQGILQDFSGASTHLFIRLRIIHPILAVGLVLFFMNWCLQKNYTRLAMEFLFAMAIGIITLLTLSPIYLKIAHLLIAHLMWSRLLYTLVSSPDSSNL